MGAALVIGIGNRLRRDDGLGLAVAAQAPDLARHGGLAPPVLRLVPQLLPELALDLAVADRVLFTDADSSACGEPRLRRLQLDSKTEIDTEPDTATAPAIPAAAAAPVFLHQLAPRQLLVLCRRLYGHQPRAHLLLLPAHDLGHGDGLSPQAAAMLPAARGLLRRWLEGSGDA